MTAQQHVETELPWHPGERFQPRYDTLVELYEHATRALPQRPLFGTKTAAGWGWMDRATFRRRTDALRAGLAGLGVQRGDRVAVIAGNSPEWAMAAYATYGLGAQFVPLYPAQLVSDWRYILRDSGAKAVFVADRAVADRLDGLRLSLPELEVVVLLSGEAGELEHSLGEVEAAGLSAPVPLAEVSPEEVAGFIYTSGTTGDPKGVLLRHRNLAHNVSAALEVFPLGPEDRSLSFLPWAHSFGQTAELHTFLAAGASMGIAESVDRIVDNLAEVQPTVLVSVPRIFNRIRGGLLDRIEQSGRVTRRLFEEALATAARRRQLAEQGRRSRLVDLKHRVLDRLVLRQIRQRFGGRLAYAISGGAALSPEVARFMEDVGIVVFEGYGLTETSPVTAVNRPGARRVGTVGQALPGIRLELDRTEVGPSDEGELVIYGHNLMKGYHGLPEEDARVFTADGGFRTGDLARIDPDGFVRITGRIKEQYKLENGKYVVPAPLEEQLQLSPLIHQVFITGHNRRWNVALVVPDPERARRLALEQGLPEEAALDNPELLARLQQEIDALSTDFKHYERVRELLLVDEEMTVENGLLTPSLKVKRREVLERYGARLEALYL